MPNRTVSPYTHTDWKILVEGSRDLQETERKVSPFCLEGTSNVIGNYLQWLLKTVKKQQGVIYVARVDGRAVGFIACFIDHDESLTTHPWSNTFGYISDAWVHKDFRKQGIFALMNACVEIYFEHYTNVCLLRLSAVAKNAAAISAYENCGYTHDNVTLSKILR